ncbi:FAD-binding oxidoreductase [Streptomyces thioluteus]|uniref:FAD-binding oxidoreductase n=1 Tax=Streptomyces thioluteus TaxID=66431 RepID=UPI0031ED242B
MIRPDSPGNAEVTGFDPVERLWVSSRERTTSEKARPFAAVPALEGDLLVDEASRQAYSTDLGNITTSRPGAVLLPRSARDVAALVRFCRAHGITVSVRGRASTTLGQSLSDGLVIDSRSLDRIHSIGSGIAEVDAGVLWKDLVTAAHRHSPEADAARGHRLHLAERGRHALGRRSRRDRRRVAHRPSGRPRTRVGSGDGHGRHRALLRGSQGRPVRGGPSAASASVL